jgi:CRISPR-associated protein Cas1
MTFQVLNWLYVQEERASLLLDHDAVRVRAPDREPVTLPLLAIEGIVCFGTPHVSTALIQRCASEGRELVFLTWSGRFAGRMEGPCSGNVLLRRAQHLAGLSEDRALAIARPIVAAKVQSSRLVLQRAAREIADRHGSGQLSTAAAALTEMLPRVREARTLDELRGHEGEAAATYFGVFPHLIRQRAFAERFDGRQRRPPRDPVNAVLSFLYTLLRMEIVAALESAGLDPQVGYLHTLRPGRPALALDLLEELRAPLADRLTLTLLNRRQLTPDHFQEEPGGAVHLNDRGREVVLAAHRQRKREEVEHPLLKQRIPWALVPHAQARVLARHLRGDVDRYVPFLVR